MFKFFVCLFVSGCHFYLVFSVSWIDHCCGCLFCLTLAACAAYFNSLRNTVLHVQLSTPCVHPLCFSLSKLLVLHVQLVDF